MKINYNTYISIIRNNEPISFRGTDLDIPLNLVPKCMYDGMLSYEDIYVYIIDVN